MASNLPDTRNARIGSEGTLSFLYVPQGIRFRELYLGLKVTASFDRSESYTRVIDGQVRCITPEIKPQNLQVIWNVQFFCCFCASMDDPSCLPQPAQGKHQERGFRHAIGVQSVRPTWFEDLAVPKGPTPQTDQGQPQPFFFRPTPSRLPPGRYTRSIVAKIGILLKHLRGARILKRS